MGVATMNAGPSQRLFQRARDWAADAEELAELQWQLFRLEAGQLFDKLRRSLLMFVAAVGLAAIGIPLAMVAGIAVLAQAMQWPLAPALAISGVVFVVVAVTLGIVAGASWRRQDWLPRSRRQARQNYRSMIVSWKTASRSEDADDDGYFHD